MRNFTQIITEERKNYDSVSLLQSEITSYINKVKKILPQGIQDIITITNKYNLGSSTDLDNIRFANKSQLPALAKQYNMPDDAINILRSLLKDNKKSIRLLPQYQTATERAALEAGKLAANDLTIDLDSTTGRNATAKMYTPLVLRIVNQYVGKSRLDRPALISAGMQGLADAINDYGKKGDDEGKKTTFKTYAGYRIQQAILNDMNKNGHTLSGGNWYNTSQYGAAAFDAVSLDGLRGDDNDDDFKQDHLAHLADTSKTISDYESAEESWKEVFKLMENKFSTRDMDIFYRYFGLGPYHGKRQKSKDIAKEYGMSEGNIRNSIINKIIKFLQTNPKANQLMIGLKDMYTESLLRDLIYFDREYIREALYNDSTFILLEEITRWNNKQVLIQTVNAACDKLDLTGAKFIYDCLIKGLDYFNSNLHKNKRLICAFLSDIYPAENISRKTDADLADYMSELIEAGKLLKVEW